MATIRIISISTFQSTPSTRRETIDFSITCFSINISIHSLHTEGDTSRDFYIAIIIIFQSTPSTRRETLASFQLCPALIISIHSLHTEGDCSHS